MADEQESKPRRTSFYHKASFWQIICIVIVVVFAGSLVFGASIWGGPDTGAMSENAVSSINKIIEAQSRPETAVLSGYSSVVLSKIKVTIGEDSVEYLTDGELIYPASGFGVINLTEALQIISAQQASGYQPESAAPQKTAKPTVELYVMSFCPFGVQAEDAMKPVVDLLGNKIDISIRFIVNIFGNTTDSVDSLHGPTEAQEDLRQVCIMNNYDQKTYWNYISEISKNCKSIYSDDAALDACWKAAANKSGIDTGDVAQCANSSYAIELLRLDEAATSAYGVSGSPTFIINGIIVSPDRSPDGIKTAICDAFTTKPAECGTQLSSTRSVSSGAECGV